MSGAEYNFGYRLDITWLPITICDDQALSPEEAVLSRPLGGASGAPIVPSKRQSGAMISGWDLAEWRLSSRPRGMDAGGFVCSD
jgi:hypothetical protein